MEQFGKQFILDRVNEEYGYIVDRRRWMHEHPELSGQEYETSKMIKAEVEKLGLPWEKASNTGIVVTMECGKPGRTIMLRADIDALPIQENPENLAGGRVCVSKNEGVMHACGHDGHTSMLLAAMKVLNGIKDQLSGTILFCFEEGEETSCGIHPMLETLSSKKIDGCWGIHLYYALDSGEISVQAGPRMAGSRAFKGTIHGKGGHGSRPDQAISPIFGAAYSLINMTNSWVNELDVTKTVTLGVGNFHSGDAFNVIPEDATFEGTIRMFDVEESRKAEAAMTRIVEQTAAMHRCEGKLEWRTIAPITTNDEQCAANAEAVLGDLFPGKVVHCNPWFASESFGFYLEKYPGVFALIGIRNPEKGTGELHHNPKFDIDEDVLKVGAASTIAYTLDFLSR